MIKERDVIEVLMPFPNISSGLATWKHYYICNKNQSSNKVFFKCQSQKPSFITNNSVRDFRKTFYTIRVSPTVPFKKSTVIDKEVLLMLNSTIVPLEYLSRSKPSNIPSGIYQGIVDEILVKGQPKYITVNRDEFIELNPNCIIDSIDDASTN